MKVSLPKSEQGLFNKLHQNHNIRQKYLNSFIDLKPAFIIKGLEAMQACKHATLKPAL
jgi:hypothetical protein